MVKAYWYLNPPPLSFHVSPLDVTLPLSIYSNLTSLILLPQHVVIEMHILLLLFTVVQGGYMRRGELQVVWVLSLLICLLAVQLSLS